MNRQGLALGLSVCCTALAGFSGCARPPLTGPPDLRLGREQCSECGMLVNEDRCSGAALVDRDGERLYIFFDDIGCMLDYEHDKGAGLTVFERYVHDFVTRQWIPGPRAVYLLADRERLRTPMGSGIAAFSGADAAERARKDSGGTVVEYAGVGPARRAWMEARHGKGND